MNSNRGRGFNNSNRGSGGLLGTGNKLYSQFSQAPRHQQVLSVVVTVLVLVLVVYLVVRLVNSYKSFQSRNTQIIPGTMQMNQTVRIDGSTLPQSVDQRYGMEFSYSNWLFINDLNSSNSEGSVAHVYHKGTPSINPNGDVDDLVRGEIGAVQAPGVWLDRRQNKLYILINTFPVGSEKSVFEMCTVENVPMKTWFHLAVVCINKNVDVFINGRLKKRQALKGLPRLNYGNLYVGGNSYDGYLSNMYYFAHALQIFELDRLVAEGPASTLFKTPEFNEAKLAQDWYLTTAYSNERS